MVDFLLAQVRVRFHNTNLLLFSWGPSRWEWREIVVEDHQTPVPDQAAFRCDFPAWLSTHSPRNRRLAEALAVGPLEPNQPLPNGVAVCISRIPYTSPTPPHRFVRLGRPPASGHRLVLGIYLIEESAAGRLKVHYGSPHVLQRLRTLLRELTGSQEPDPSSTSKPDSRSSLSTAAEPDLHGVNHGVRLEDAAFDGRGGYVEIPASPKLRLGAADFTVAAWVHTERDIDDVIGAEAGEFYL